VAAAKQIKIRGTFYRESEKLLDRARALDSLIKRLPDVLIVRASRKIESIERRLAYETKNRALRYTGNHLT
jgi:hypothetical protein